MKTMWRSAVMGLIAMALPASAAANAPDATPPAPPPAAPPAAADEAPLRLPTTLRPPTFRDVSIHDPAIIRDGEWLWIFGSHLGVARTRDLIAWELVGAGVRDEHPVVPNVTQQMRDALEWGQSRTFWAGCVARLADGRFHFYYSVCKGDSPRAALGHAVADRAGGPYRNEGILLRSGMWGQASEDGTVYDATVHPNAIDPDVFFDADGRPWMIYGSYSGGIFILKLDPTTGKPLPGQGYGKKLLGANHSRIEAPAVLHHPATKYYYLFLSFGGLDAGGGYQVRVARSRNPDGPYLDPQGNDLIAAHGPKGTFFHDASIEPFGGKLVGNFQFTASQRPEAAAGIGYVSPGHNTVYFDEASGRSFLIMHTRFPGRREEHQVRVHQLLMNADGWPVMAPHRFAGETIERYTPRQIAGAYQLVSHGTRITPEITESKPLQLHAGGRVSGSTSGSWKSTGDHTATVTLAGVAYHGAFLRQWDSARNAEVMTFSGLSDRGTAVWIAGLPE
jgi:arabinan endo-1,5-alpha-L-arabinosidase